MVTATSGATGPYCVASSPPPSPAQKRKPACEQAPQRKAHSVAGLTSMSLSRLGFSELETVRQSSDLPAASSVERDGLIGSLDGKSPGRASVSLPGSSKTECVR